MLTLPLHGLPPGPLAFSPDGGLLALIGGSGVQVYDLAAGRRLWGPANCRHDGGLAFSADGRLLAGVGLEGFEASTGRVVAVPRPGDWRPATDPRPGEGRVAERSACGRWAVTYPPNRLLDRVAGRDIPLDRLVSGGPGVRQADRVPLWGPGPLRFSPDGEWLAGTFTVRILAVRTADLLAGSAIARSEPANSLACVQVPTAVLRVPRKHVQDLAWTPDGRTLLAVSNEALVRRWDTATWAAGPSYGFDTGPLTSVAVSPDGLRAAAASGKRIMVWDLE